MVEIEITIQNYETNTSLIQKFFLKVEMNAHKSEKRLKSQCHKTNVAEARIQYQSLQLEAHPHL